MTKEQKLHLELEERLKENFQTREVYHVQKNRK